MTETVLFFVHYAFTLLFGIALSFAFCGLRFVKNTNWMVLLLFVLCGTLQIGTLFFFGEEVTWKIYPLITHLPIAVLLCTVFRKRLVTAIAAISLSYLCCQPSKWFGIFTELFTDSGIIVLCIRILVILSVAFITLRFLSGYISEIFNKDTQSVWIFSGVPIVYYLYDYAVGIYTDLRDSHYQLVAEFSSLFLCISFVAFCVIYYKEYEKKAEAERRKQIIEITVEQQIKEIDAIRQSNIETKLFRHDMRFFLSNLAFSIEQNDSEKALSMISSFTEKVNATSIHRYCANDTINYVLIHFKNRCDEAEIEFNAAVEIGSLSIDELLLSSIISNALDNAVHAQAGLPKEKRYIKLMLKDSNGKLLLSVKNPFEKAPLFIDGLPVSDRKGHGYGTQSIRYMTEKLGGKCQFVTENDLFVLRIVL